jgi:NADH dehydrogenase (ubiquinone) 1 alpha subcomplex subunit 2
LNIKNLNPGLPFIVRECTNAQPNVMVRYDFGVEKRIYLNDLTEEEVDQAVAELVTQADDVNAAMPGI